MIRNNAGYQNTERAKSEARERITLAGAHPRCPYCLKIWNGIQCERCADGEEERADAGR